MGVKITFPVERPLGNRGVLPVVTAEDAWYDAIYRYEVRGKQWWAILDRLEEIMPARPPQASALAGDDGRLHLMRADGSLDVAAEAEQRRREWAQVNRD